MNNSIIVGLLQNTAILLASAMIYEYIWVQNEDTEKLQPKIISGLILGGVCIILMYTPWTLIPGLVFDTRSVLLSITGLFFGAIPTILAMLISGIARWFMGGEGLLMGLAVIFTSGTIGLLWRKFRPFWTEKNYIWELLSMGFLVHVAMLLCTFLLPKEDILPTLKVIALPLLLIYTPATMLLGIVLVKQYNNWKNRKAQLKLTESERRFNQILKSGNIVSMILNKDATILFCNEYFLQITGYSYDEVAGRNWFETFIPAERREELFKLFSQGMLSRDSILTHENQILTKSKERLHISWYNITLLSNHTKVTGLASIGVNITDSKNYEQMLEEKNKAIELQNEEYKQINKALQKAKEHAEESDRLKTAFLANMSHEIRTPMNGILGFADLLKKPKLTDQERFEYISIIEESGKRMLKMINDIISIAKIETGIVDVKLTDTNINEQIDYIQTFFTPIAEKKKILLITHKSLPESESIVNTDNEKIYAVLINLVNNALKFTEKGEVEFGYSDKGKNLEFFVRDTGKGIKAENQELIFERFRQDNESVLRKYEGTGLGLAISKAYIEMLGGKIWVESEPGKGATFYFTIPFIHSNLENTTSFETSAINTDGAAQNLNILIVEDDDNSIKLLMAYVKNYGKNILVAENGEEAVKICKNNPDIDLIFMDIELPVMDGYEATHKIREFNKNVKIIAETAYALPGDKEKALEAGCNAWYSKPLSKNEMVAIIKSTSQNKRK